MSATGSVIMGAGLLGVFLPGLRCRSPAGLGHARDLSEQRQLAEADAAERELPEVGAGTAAAAAAVAELHLELRRALPLLDLALFCHVASVLFVSDPPLAGPSQ